MTVIIMYCFTFLELCLLITVVEVVVVFDYFFIEKRIACFEVSSEFSLLKTKKRYRILFVLS